jgi:TRAP-type C4-dicarboxylate transport system permease small subunit
MIFWSFGFSAFLLPGRPSMNALGLLARIGRSLLNLVELYIPTVSFVVLFVSFMTQIVARYFFRPLLWPEELSLLCFVWTALLGGLYAKRDNSHVAFTMLYDAAKPGMQRFMRITGNLLMLLAFSIALYPSWKYVSFMSYKKSDVMLIPMNIVFFPFIVFLVFMMGRIIIDLVHDFRPKKSGGTA